MKRFFTAMVTALTLVLLVGTGAQAGPINPENVTWTYNFTPGTPAVTADGNPAAGVTFTNEPTGTAVGSSDIVATNLRVFSAAPGGIPDVLTSNGAYSLTLNVSALDKGKPLSGSLTFTGKLTGTLSKENSNIANQFTGVHEQTLSLGAYTFTVSLNSYTPPGPPDQSNAGSIAAHVAVSTLVPSQVPEPSAIVLSCLGGLSFLGAAWRRKMQARA
jgi:hypothetical protein